MIASQLGDIQTMSFAWIREHPHATNLDVPDNLREAWIFEPASTGVPQGFFLSVFAFGFLQSQALRAECTVERPFQISESQLIEHFSTWQLKLSLAGLSRRTSFRMAPLPLWDFSDDEMIEIQRWPDL